MSLEAMTWAMQQTIVTNPTDRHVLLIMANPAWKDGTNSFQSIKSICDTTGLSRRTVQMSIERLLDVGAIKRGDVGVRDAKIKRADMRPNVYDLCIERGASAAPRETNGAHLTHERGASAAPDPNITPDIYISPRAREADAGLPEDEAEMPNEEASDVPNDTQQPANVEAAILLRRRNVSTNPSDPRLLDAIANGVTPQELADLADELPGKPIAYLAKTCVQRRNQRINLQGDNHANGHRNRGEKRRLTPVERTMQAIKSRRERNGTAEW